MSPSRRLPVRYASRRPAAHRWPHIGPSLRSGDRVLDFGSAEGEFATLAAEAGCAVVAVDEMRLPELLPEGVTAVRRRCTADDLAGFGSFEVVLALSVLHHLPRWRETFEKLQEVALRHLFVEVPHPEEVGVVGDDLQALHDHVAAAGGTLLCFTPGWDATRLRPLWRFDL